MVLRQAHYTLVHTDEGAGGAGTWM